MMTLVILVKDWGIEVREYKGDNYKCLGTAGDWKSLMNSIMIDAFNRALYVRIINA